MHLAGKSGVFDVTDTFAGVFKSLATLCMRACMSNGFVSSLGHSRSPMRSFVPLAGKFGIADTFSGLFELSVFSCACMRVLSMPERLLTPSVLSGQGLVLPVRLLHGSTHGCHSADPHPTCC